MKAIMGLQMKAKLAAAVIARLPERYSGVIAPDTRWLKTNPQINWIDAATYAAFASCIGSTMDRVVADVLSVVFGEDFDSRLGGGMARLSRSADDLAITFANVDSLDMSSRAFQFFLNSDPRAEVDIIDALLGASPRFVEPPASPAEVGRLGAELERLVKR